MSNQATVFMIINQGGEGDYCLAIRGGMVVLALSNPRDAYQQWMKKDSVTKDQEGQPAFFIVNKATNQAIKHEGPHGPLLLVPYDVNSEKDKTLLWSDSKYEDQGFRFICRAVATNLHLTANCHIVEDGRIVDHSAGNHITERWRFAPVLMPTTPRQTVTISCRRKDGYNLTIRDNTLVLAPADPKDRNQIWIKDLSYCKQVKDQDNKRAFALVHRATGKAISHGFGQGYLAQLAPFNPDYLDGSILWTENEKDNGFSEIRKQSNTSTVFHAFYVNEPDSNKALLALRSRNDSNDQRWKFQQATWTDPIDDTTTTSAKPTNAGAENSKDTTKPGTWNTNKADLVIDEA